LPSGSHKYQISKVEEFVASTTRNNAEVGFITLIKFVKQASD